MRSNLKHYIDGAWVESDGGTRHEVINPATEAAVTEITLGSEADVDKAVAAARRAFESFSRTGVDERIALIERILTAYKARAADMAEAISLEMVVIHFFYGGMPKEKAEKSLRLFAKKVLPAVQAMPTPINPSSRGGPASLGEPRAAARRA